MGDEQALLSGVALSVFKLNGQVLSVAEDMAHTAGLTAARWQVLGAVLMAPLPVAGIAREMGISRQAVQRIADLLVADGLAEYLPNPAHRRAKLVSPTEAGRAANAGIGPAHAVVARQLSRVVGRERLRETLAALQELSTAFDKISAGAAS
jgi:DNA-binding MarR family transcriptional regulator